MKLKINDKITGLFLIVMIIFILFAGSAFFIIRNVQATFLSVNDVYNRAHIVSDIQIHVNRLLVPVNRYLITGDIKERGNFGIIVNDISRLFNDVSSFKKDENWASLVERAQKDTAFFSEKAAAILNMEKPVGSVRAQELVNELNFLSDRLIQEVEGFHRITGNELREVEQNVRAQEKRNRVFTVVVFAGTLSFALLLSFYLRKTITGPVIKLHRGVEIIARGDLLHRIEIKTGDELESLADEFNRMTASLEAARKELDRKIFELYTLYSVSKSLSTGLETEGLIDNIVETVARDLKIDRVILMLADEDAHDLVVESCYGFDKESVLRRRFRIGEGLYGKAASKGISELIAEADKCQDITMEEKFDIGINSIIIVPFGVTGKLVGALAVFRNSPDVFDNNDLELLKSIAEHVAIALENARLYRETRLMAITDGLTGIFNHRYFVESMGTELHRARRYSHPLSLIMMDLDYFKRYNDAHGHQMGDLLLKLITALIVKGLRDTDIMARYGGEEFAVILVETDKNSAMEIAERIRKTVDEYIFPYEHTQPGGNVTISLGVASLESEADTVAGLIKRADDALYEAKKSGRNRVVVAA